MSDDRGGAYRKLAAIRDLTAALSRPSLRIALIVACAQFMQNLDGTIIVTALPAMAGSFATSVSRMSEGITAYALAAAMIIPASAWLADRLGTRNVFGAAIGLFTLSSLACGLAGSFPGFIGARLAQGASAAMMSPVGRMIVLGNSERRELMQTLSMLTWPGLIAPAIGPPLGGLITSEASWRWIFYVNLPFGAIAVALVLAMVPNHRSSERHAFDVRGFALLTTAIGCLTYGFDVVGGRHVDVPLAAALFTAAVVSGVMALRHIRSTRNPVVRLDALRRRPFFVACFSGGAVSRVAINATPFLLPLMLQVGFGLSPLVSGFLLLIYMAANLLMKLVTNPVMRRFGLRRVLMVNGVISAACIAACAAITGGLPTLLTGIILFAAGASRSMQFTALTFTTFAETTSEERSSATVLSALAQRIAVAIGVTAAALILNFSRALRQATALTVFDFRVALVAMGIVGATAFFSYANLAEGTGTEVTGHRSGVGAG